MNETKEIVINEVRYCQYELDGGHLFIKIDNCLPTYDVGRMEDSMKGLIEILEGVEIRFMSYLNTNKSHPI